MTKANTAVISATNTAAPAAKPAETGATAETKAPEVKAEEPAKDIFADLPVVRVGEADVLDLSTLETSPERKYAKVAEDARTDKLPVMRGWKHTNAMLIAGHNKGGENGFKSGSVNGTILDIVTRAGKAGIPAYEVATELRKRQIGNKRSHYCTALPPVGWAEGWLNSAITVGIAKVHASAVAKGLVIPTAAKDTEATDAQNKAAVSKAA